MAARCQALWNEPERIRALAGAGLEVLVGEPGRTLHGWPPSATASCSNSPGAAPM
jgi:hypothetical protein